MKIGILTRYLAVGDDCDSGIGQHYRILADALTEQGHEVHVVLATSQQETAQVSLATLNPKWSWEVVTASAPQWLNGLARLSWPLRGFIEDIYLSQAAARVTLDTFAKKQFPVVETHSFGAPARALLAARRRPRIVTRVSTTARQVNELNRIRSRVLRWVERAERIAIQRSDALITHTEHHRDLICSAENIPTARFQIVPHGLPDPGRPSPTQRTHDAAVRFLYVGRFEHRKGIDVLLAAIPLVIKACPETSFVLAGAVADGQQWKQFARSFPNLADTRVRALGRVSAPERDALYRNCDVLVAPSRYESFGLIYPEAMAHGKPVIGCRCGGVPEVVKDGITGLLAEPGDVASLVAAMVRLARDPNLRNQMGEAGRADFVSRFSAAQMAMNSARVYTDLLRK